MADRITYFKPPVKYPFGFTEEQIREAFIIYDKKVKEDILIKLQQEFPFLTNALEADESVLQLLMRTVDIAVNTGMEMSVNHMDVLHHYREVQNEKKKPTYNTTLYDFETDKGVSGVLLPDGEFIMCGNAEHYMFVEDISFDVQKQCVYFSSFLDGNGGLITLSPLGNSTMTDEQKCWINNNIIYLDNEQRDMYEQLIED